MTVMSEGLLLNSNFEPKPNLSKTLKGLLMRLVVFENTIVHLNSLTITVFVCYVSGSKVNRKERSRPSLLVCFFFSSTLLNISSSRSIWFCRVSVLSGVLNGHRKSMPFKLAPTSLSPV